MKMACLGCYWMQIKQKENWNKFYQIPCKRILLVFMIGPWPGPWPGPRRGPGAWQLLWLEMQFNSDYGVNWFLATLYHQKLVDRVSPATQQHWWPTLSDSSVILPSAPPSLYYSHSLVSGHQTQKKNSIHESIKLNWKIFHLPSLPCCPLLDEPWPTLV